MYYLKMPKFKKKNMGMFEIKEGQRDVTTECNT